ncbi:MAG: hypothetical protein C0480_01110 [Bradyrhizobium sp.]|nr:hypothetical protein [Bradyrhizobium sp.]
MDYSDVPPRPKTVRCAKCKRSIRVKPQGRIPVFCSPACRQAAFKRLKRAKQQALPRAPTDFVTAHEVQHREMTWRLLQDAGLVPRDQPPPPKQK